jgi:hypothetical protein
MMHAGKEEYDDQDEEISSCSDTPDGDVGDLEGKVTDRSKKYVIESISTASRNPSPPDPATAVVTSLDVVLLFMVKKLLSLSLESQRECHCRCNVLSVTS